jgi:hypothetical protein
LLVVVVVVAAWDRQAYRLDPERRNLLQQRQQQEWVVA